MERHAIIIEVPDSGSSSKIEMYGNASELAEARKQILELVDYEVDNILVFVNVF